LFAFLFVCFLVWLIGCLFACLFVCLLVLLTITYFLARVVPILTEVNPEPKPVRKEEPINLEPISNSEPVGNQNFIITFAFYDVLLCVALFSFE
jgi:hypothetical protein